MVGGYLRTQAEVMLDDGRGNTLVGYRRLLMIGPRSHQRSRARPRRILIVEDELVIALMMEEIVREMGCAVSGIAGTLGMARLQFAKRDFDAALLDVNLGGEYNPETADLLLEMGVPFAFVTGYDYVVDPRHDNVPLLQKPFSSIQLRVLVERLIGSVLSGDGAAQSVLSRGRTHPPFAACAVLGEKGEWGRALRGNRGGRFKDLR